MLFGGLGNCFAISSTQNPKVVKEEQTVTLIGKFVKATGEDARERTVTFDALKLDKPITIMYDEGVGYLSKAETDTFKLWLSKQQEIEFKKLLNQQVKVTAKVHYYWFGPSTFPIAEKLEVSRIDSISSSNVTTSTKQVSQRQHGNVSDIVNIWSEAHNTQDAGSFSQIFAPKAKFYGTELSANKIVDEKRRLFKRYPDFFQEIIGNVACKSVDQPSVYRCEFTKRVTFGGRQKDFPSYLVMDTSTKEPKIIVESDHITDRNLK